MSKREALWEAYAARRAQAIFEAEERKERVYRAYPALAELERRITALGSRYCTAMAQGAETAALEAEMQAMQQKRDALLRSTGVDIEPHFACAVCRDTGLTENGLCDCFRRALIALNFEDSNLDKSAKTQSFEQFDFSLFSEEAPAGGLLSPRENMRRLYRLAQDFVRRFDMQERSLLFTGATGLGKTYLSTCIAGALLARGKSVIYISAPEFARRVENARFKDESDLHRQLAECDMLIIDDLGTESRTAYTMATLTDLMDQRIRAGRPMLFSTNLNLDGIQNAYDERVVSRLLGNFIYCYFYGQDLRRKAFETQ